MKQKERHQNLKDDTSLTINMEQKNEGLVQMILLYIRVIFRGCISFESLTKVLVDGPCEQIECFCCVIRDIELLEKTLWYGRDKYLLY